MRIVCAPDSFKGSLGAWEVARAVARGISASAPSSTVTAHPLSDGGEGTLEILSHHGFQLHERTIRNHRGQKIVARFGLRDAVAVVESALACGFEPQASPEDALLASSVGVGELISHALDAGAREILLTLGGTASTDGGVGMARALGYEFFDDHGSPIPSGGGGLRALHTIDRSGRDARLDHVTISALTDVDNPLCGPRGAAFVFAPQKGADSEAVEALEEGLSRLVEVSSSPHAEVTGAGAGGGLGFGSMEFLGATTRSGAKSMMELTGFDEALDGADLVITGEGSFDDQSLEGKIPFEVIKRARAKGIPVQVVCGVNAATNMAALQTWGIERIWALVDVEPNRQQSISHAASLLEGVGAEIGALTLS